MSLNLSAGLAQSHAQAKDKFVLRQIIRHARNKPNISLYLL